MGTTSKGCRGNRILHAVVYHTSAWKLNGDGEYFSDRVLSWIGRRLIHQHLGLHLYWSWSVTVRFVCWSKPWGWHCLQKTKGCSHIALLHQHSTYNILLNPCTTGFFFFLEIGSAWAKRAGQGGGEWVYRKAQKQPCCLHPGCRRALVDTGRVIFLLLCMNWLRKQTSALWGLRFWQCHFFLGGHWLRAVTIENSLMSGCGLSHESAEGGCKGNWVKFWASKPKGAGNMVHLRDP